MAGPKKRGRPKKPVDEKEQSRAWDFTDFHIHDEGRFDWWKSLEYSLLHISEEVCPDTQRIHAQARIIFRRNYRFAQLKKIFPPDVRFAATKADADFNYGRKWNSKLLISDDNRSPGRRNVFTEQRDLIANGGSIRDCIACEGANLQSVRSAQILMEYIEPPRPIGDVEVIKIQDITEALTKETDLYQPPLGEKGLHFWPGYDAHAAVAIDCALHEPDIILLRRLCSPYPFKLNVKNGCRQARFTRLYLLRPPERFC